MLDRIEFLISEAFSALRRNGWMTFAAVSTVAVSLFLLGGLGYIYLRVSDYAESLPNKYDMRVFLKDDVSQDVIRETAKKIRGIDGVNTAVWLPKEVEWKKWKTEFPGALTEGESPFPDAFKVTILDIEKATSVANGIRSLNSVVEVRYDDATQSLIQEVLRFVRWLGSALGGLLFFTAGVLIYNAIRLTIDARRREVRIMQLVGATNQTIRVPFILEGVIQGAIGGVVSTVLLASANAACQSVISQMTAIGRVPPFPVMKIMGLLIVVGSAYGFVCAYLAMRRPLKQ
ncbi:MAG TPA: permease-like cell division protein FtsX [Fimbriimonadaceae bacterium]|nr:permease-like cell division protein FtsX [Fimbriimonadaceae bacterium]